MDRDASWFKRPFHTLPSDERTSTVFMQLHTSVELESSTPPLLKENLPDTSDRLEDDQATPIADPTEVIGFGRGESPSRQLELESTNATIADSSNLEYPHYLKYGMDSKSYTIIGRADQHNGTGCHDPWDFWITN